MEAGRPRTSSSTRSHWGWGYAERAPTRASLEAIAPEVRRRLGFGADSVEEPVPLAAIEPAPPRLRPPDELSDILSADPADRIRHSMGRAYRDVVRGFRGRFDRTPDMVAFPGDAEDVRRVLEMCADRRLAAVPFGGGTSVVGGVEPRVGHGYRGTVSIDLGALERDRRDRRGLELGPDPGRDARARPRGRPAAPRAHPAPFSPVVRVLHPRRLDRDPGGRSFRHPADPHRRPGRLDHGADADRPLGEPQAARLRGRSEPRPHDPRLRGHPGSDHRGLGAGSPTAPFQGLPSGPLRELRRRRGGGAGDLAIGPPPVELPVARSPRGGDHRGLGRLLRRADRRVRIRLRARRRVPAAGGRMRRRPRREARGREGRRGRLGRPDLALGLPRRPLPARQPRRPRGAQRDLRDGDHLGPVPRVPLAGRRGGEAGGRRGHRRPGGRRGGAAGHVPLHPRLSQRSGPLLHGARQGPARLGGRAVGRDQGGRLGGDHLRRRDDHPSPRGRPRSSPLVRHAATRSVRGGARRGQGGGRPGGDTQPGRPHRPRAQRPHLAPPYGRWPPRLCVLDLRSASPGRLPCRFS